MISTNTFVVGDLQGCQQPLTALIEKIHQLEPNPRLIFAGDLVNRGPQSLETLRLLRSLGERAQVVLGNHDLHLLAVAAGIRQPSRGDTLDPILQAPDRDDLINWLRQQPLARIEEEHLIVHAGVLPQWSAAQTVALSGEIESALRSADWQEFLRDIYGNQPAQWHPELSGSARSRCIVNALTRLRFCSADGTMDFTSSEGADSAPPGCLPWFEIPGRQTENITVVFGHWSKIGLMLRPNLISLDTACVWGGKLSAVRLVDRTLVQVDCPRQPA